MKPTIQFPWKTVALKSHCTKKEHLLHSMAMHKLSDTINRTVPPVTHHYTKNPSDICIWGKCTVGPKHWARIVWTLLMIFFWCPSSETPMVSKSFTVSRNTCSIVVSPACKKLSRYRSILMAASQSSTDATSGGLLSMKIGCLKFNNLRYTTHS